MKKMLAVMLTLMCASSVFAFDNDDAIVRWKSIVGVITIPGVDNPVGGIRAGATPWTVRSGHASVNLVTGHTSFEVEGLSINGGNSTGTPGPISAVTGTLVCNAGATAQAVLDTAAVPLNAHGDANFSGQLRARHPSYLLKPAIPGPHREPSRRCWPLDCHRNRAIHR